MELIPILSTIILVATISTFMLAVGAYILYKVRERKGIQVVSQQPSEINAELVTPVSSQQVPSERSKPQPIFVGPQSPYQRQQPSAQPFQQRYSSGPIPYNGYGNQPRNYSEQDNSQQRAYAGNLRNIQPQGELKPKSAKFMKYTSEGYVPTKEDKDSGALRWK